jgi:hypothetical protein
MHFRRTDAVLRLGRVAEQASDSRPGDAEARIGDAAQYDQSDRHHGHQGIARQYIDAPLACFMRAKTALLDEREKERRQTAYPGARGKHMDAIDRDHDGPIKPCASFRGMAKPGRP